MAIVDVAHEALIRHWKLLRQWIEQNRDLLRQQRSIEANAVVWRDQGQKSGYLLQGLPLTEAIHFEKQQHDTFPLSDSAKAFIQKSIRQRHWNRVKTASWLIIPALLVIGLVEHSLREASVTADRARLDQEGTYEEKQAVQALVQGCASQQNTAWLPSYLAERLFGNCRSLYQAPLVKADLSDANLRDANLISADLRDANLSDADLISADLRDANLISADLRDANLISADLRDANLSNANLSNANLSNANLISADLSDADLSYAKLISTDLSYANLSSTDLRAAHFSNSILLATDLRSAENLQISQLTGEEPPLLCNVVLPPTLTEVDPNRDCDQMSKVLADRYGTSLEEATGWVNEAKQEKWD